MGETEEAPVERNQSFDQFRDWLAQALDLPPEQLHRDTRLREDLALDSIGMFELAIALDVLDRELPEELAWNVSTVGEAYECLGRPQKTATTAGDE
jgi:acyl carrier protein